MIGLAMQVFAVDDNRQVIFDIKKAVKHYRLPAIRGASSEQEGLRLVENFRKDKYAPLFIVDLKLKDSDSGFRIIKAIRSKKSLKYAPIVILTSSDDQSYVNRGYELGANSYIVKDDDPTELNSLIAKVIKFWKEASFHDLATGPSVRPPSKRKRRK